VRRVNRRFAQGVNLPSLIVYSSIATLRRRDGSWKGMGKYSYVPQVDEAIVQISSMLIEGYFTYFYVSKIAYCPQPPSSARRSHIKGL